MKSSLLGSFFDSMFSGFLWYRRFIGGKWEMWRQTGGGFKFFRAKDGSMPTLLCCGTPRIDDFDKSGDTLIQVGSINPPNTKV